MTADGAVAAAQPDTRTRGEFVTLMALLISLVALSIDAMLPALPLIGADLGVTTPNHNQLVVSVLFLGMAFGQLFYGPLSDRFGRKPAIYLGLVLFMLGSLLSLLASDFNTMLAGRLLQGLGAAASRTVTTALIRDQYEGREMAQMMSFIMAVFILVPALAPALGQGIMVLAGWRMIFVSFLVLAGIAFVWFALRQPETLPVDRRKPLSPAHLGRAVWFICTNRIALGYTLTAGLIFGAFVGYLTSAQAILQAQYALGPWFPAAFALLSLAIGAASVINARLVIRFGMRLLSRRALVVLTGLSIGFFGVAFMLDGHPPLWALLAWGLAAFFCIGILFGNLTAMSMEPLGAIAGVGAAVVSSITTFVSLSLGTTIGLAYDGTVLPLVGGFALLGVAALTLMRWVEVK